MRLSWPSIQLQDAERFPSGVRNLTDCIHALGLYAHPYLWRCFALKKQASTVIRVGTPARCIPDHIKTKKGLKLKAFSFLQSYSCRDSRLFRETWGFDLLKGVQPLNMRPL